MTFDPSIMTRKCQYNCSPTQSPEAITTGFSLPIGWMLLLIHFIYDVTSNNLLQTVSPSYQPLLRVIFIQPTLLNNNVHTGPLPIVCLPFLNSLVRLLTVRTSLCSARPWCTGTHDGLLMRQESCFLLTWLPDDGSTQPVGDPWGHFQSHPDLIIPKKRAETKPWQYDFLVCLLKWSRLNMESHRKPLKVLDTA